MKNHFTHRSQLSRLLPLVLCFATSGVLCLGADEPIANGESSPTAAPKEKKSWADPYDVEPGKEYTYKQSGGNNQKLEAYFPADWKAGGDSPAILFFHGGAWVGGDLKQFRYECKYFASRGLVAATANYQMLPASQRATLQPKGAFIRPCIIDAKSAIRWMKAHTAELGIDPKRIIVGGGSAGGHLALLATISPDLNDPKDPQNIDTKVAAYVLLNPGYPNSQDDEVDPFKQIKTPLPPAILFHGTRDPYLPGSIALVKQLKSLGDNDIELWTAQDKAHGFFNYRPWTDVVLAQVDQFLSAHGFLKGDPTLLPPPHGEKLDRAL